MLSLVCGLLLLGAIGCSRSTPSASTAATQPTIPAGAGVIEGVVRLTGPIPKMMPIPMPAGTDCHPASPPIVDETVVADEQGRMAGVFVYIDNAPNVDLPAPTVVMDQIDCRFVPHVVAVRTGQVLRFSSKDSTLHNVRAECSANPPFNFAMASAGEFKDMTFASPEYFTVHCDVHPWMTGLVGVFDHPLFAVTAPGGAFRIAGIPPGTYTLVARHDRYGMVRQTIIIPPGVNPPPVHADFAFAPPR